METENLVPGPGEEEKEELEIKLLLETLSTCYGYNFTQYARASLTRRIRKGVNDAGLTHISEAVPRLIHDKEFFRFFITRLPVSVTEIFRDPSFFRVLREEVIPYLRTFPVIRVWSAGVATGEEAYSLAVLFKEEGVYDKTIIYATDFSDTALSVASKGIYPVEDIKKGEKNYRDAGGKFNLSDYFYADYDSAIFHRSLRQNIVFANHNVVTDSSFGEMHLILCRNVLIYFNTELQNKVLSLFAGSLSHNGFLGLGSKESLRYADVASDFVEVGSGEKIYQKKQVQQYECTPSRYGS